jgi:hypothetical protein
MMLRWRIAGPPDTVEELDELVAGFRRLLGAIENGTLEADAGTISGLEGAAAIQALAEGRNR